MINFIKMNIKKDSKVLLTYDMEGRLGATVSNSSTKEEISKMIASPHEYFIKGKWFSPKHRYVGQNNFQEREKQNCIHKTVLNEKFVQYAISEDGFCGKHNKKSWKRLSIKNRLEAHLELLSDGNPYTYEILD